MTKEDCIDALLELFDYAKKGRYIRPGGTGIDTYLEEKADVLLELIHDRFDNFPLMFEELKEGMWVWDDVEKEFLKVKCVCVAEEGHYIFKEGTKFIAFVLCGIRSRTMDVEFEPNRFYRKQVEE